MKRLLPLLCLPLTIVAGDQSPVNWNKLEAQYLKVEALEEQFTQLQQEYKDLKSKLEGQERFLEEATKLQAELETLDPESILYEIASAPLHKLQEKQQREQEKLKNVETTYIKTGKELEREVWYATGLEMRDYKEKLEGTAQIVKDREQRNQNNQDNQRDGIPSALKNAKRGGPDEHQRFDTAIKELFTHVQEFEEQVIVFSRVLMDAGHGSQRPAPSEADLQILFGLKAKTKELKKELGDLVAAAHPEKNERLQYLETLGHPKVEQPRGQDKNQVKRSGRTSITLIIPILKVYSIHP